MIHFIVCDDEALFREKIVTIIDQLMMKRDTDYQIKQFGEYNKQLEEVIKSDLSSKIYILDIELPKHQSGIDIARRIRQQDWNSIIIMVTSHSELGYEALKAQIMLLDFISKYNDCETNLSMTLKKALQKVDQKKVLTFEYANVLYRLYLDDIIMVERDTIDRKSIIKTTYSEFIINKSILEMESLLDDRFYVSHRSCIVNTTRIRSVNWRDSVIYFDNGEKCLLLAREKKKGLRKIVAVD